MTDVSIHGHCDDRFAKVKDVFATNFDERGDVGASVCVLLGGKPVVDLWGGWADAARSRPWQQDTLVNIWSSSKGVVALAAQMLVDRGELDLDAPVATYWPEFAAAGKADLPVRYLLSHRAGLSGPREPVSAEDLNDWEKITGLLAAQEPFWEPGTASGYHALSYGFLVGEVIRRVTGRTPGTFIAEEIAGPLGADLHMGLGDAEVARAAQLIQEPPSLGGDYAALFAQLDPPALAALTNPPMAPPGAADAANADGWRRAEIPAVNIHCTARALATVYAVSAGRGAVGDVRLLTPAGSERLREGQGRGVDLVLGAALAFEMEWALGVVLSGPEGNYGPNPRAYGHDGYGGSFGLADPEAGIAIGYVMNHMGQALSQDPRKVALVDATFASL